MTIGRKAGGVKRAGLNKGNRWFREIVDPELVDPDVVYCQKASFVSGKCLALGDRRPS